jgi:sorbose reductase
MIQKYPDQVKNWLGDCPAGRFCKVWELKGVYVFLASMASSYVTGSDYLVDGKCYPFVRSFSTY